MSSNCHKLLDWSTWIL